LRTLADSVALPAFAAERRAAARLRLTAGPPTAANPHAAAGCGGQMGQTDRQTDGRTPYRSTEPAPHTMLAMPLNTGWSAADCQRCRLQIKAIMSSKLRSVG